MCASSTRQNTTMEYRGGQEIPSLVKELLVINSFQEQLALIKGVAFDS